MRKNHLMIPGPTPVPERVMAAMSKPMINHRGQEFQKLLRGICQDMKGLLGTANDVLIFPAAGTGVMEAAVVNVLSPGDKVLAVSIGVFGDRFADIAARFGADVEKMDFPPGEAADPARVAARLAEDKAGAIKAVFITHNETSTGVLNDIAALSKARQGHQALFMVDAVSSLGATEILMDEWMLDVVFTGSQKALMVPPGLGVMALSDRAWQACEQSTMPKFYWDALAARKSLAKGQTPYTPAVSLLYGLEESLKIIAEEGCAANFARHALLVRMLRAGIKALGLRLLADDRAASPSVTAVWGPEGIEPKRVQQVMRELFGIVLAGGQRQLENKIFRIGHLGYAVETDVLLVLAALEIALTELGAKVELGAGVKAAQQVYLAGRNQA